jgi:hypothetical protein
MLIGGFSGHICVPHLPQKKKAQLSTIYYFSEIARPAASSAALLIRNPEESFSIIWDTFTCLFVK